MATFTYEPSPYVPFRDKEALEKARTIRREDMDKHPNPDLHIRILPGHWMEFVWVADMFERIKRASEAGEKIVLILPNPVPRYRKVAYLLNKFRVDCSRVYAFAMDEYADQDGRIAPPDWPQGFTHAMMTYFYGELDEKLRPPEKQFVGFTDRNLPDYGKMITDHGGADACYSGPGWTGHLAFIEPDAPEFEAPLDEWKTMGPRIVTLSPFTLAQNSLHGSFGMSGDIAIVPPKAATIGPAQVIESKYRMDQAGITVHGTATAWQRLIARLCYHGPVTPLVPTSIHQTLKSDILISEEIARDIEPDFEKGY